MLTKEEARVINNSSKAAQLAQLGTAVREIQEDIVAILVALEELEGSASS